MFKTILAVVVMAIAVAAYGIYSARALPSWFDESKANTDYAGDTIDRELGKGGIKLLKSKSLDILRGRVSFSEAQFNALLMASLKADEDGRKLLKVSDGVRAFLRDEKIEISAVVNLNKLGKVDRKARDAVEKFNKLFWIIEDGRVAVTLYGTPVVRRGGIGVKDDFYAKVGEISFSNDTLRKLKVPVERANKEYLEIQYLNVQDVSVSNNDIEFGVRARF